MKSLHHITLSLLPVFLATILLPSCQYATIDNLRDMEGQFMLRLADQDKNLARLESSFQSELVEFKHDLNRSIEAHIGNRFVEVSHNTEELRKGVDAFMSEMRSALSSGLAGGREDISQLSERLQQLRSDSQLADSSLGSSIDELNVFCAQLSRTKLDLSVWEYWNIPDLRNNYEMLNDEVGNNYKSLRELRVSDPRIAISAVAKESADWLHGRLSRNVREMPGQIAVVVRTGLDRHTAEENMLARIFANEFTQRLVSRSQSRVQVFEAYHIREEYASRNMQYPESGLFTVQDLQSLGIDSKLTFTVRSTVEASAELGFCEISTSLLDGMGVTIAKDLSRRVPFAEDLRSTSFSSRPMQGKPKEVILDE